MDTILTDFSGHIESILNIIADNPPYAPLFEAELTRLLVLTKQTAIQGKMV